MWFLLFYTYLKYLLLLVLITGPVKVTVIFSMERNDIGAKQIRDSNATVILFLLIHSILNVDERRVNDYKHTNSLWFQ